MLATLGRSLVELPTAWDRFWFSKAPSAGASLYRVAVASVAALYFATSMAWVPQWLSGDGWFDLETGRYLIGEGLPDTGSQYRWSPLYVFTQSWAAYAICIAGLLASLAAVFGLGSRVAVAIAWLCLLTVHHRAPLLATPGEVLLAAGLFYLMIDPGRTIWSARPAFDDGQSRVTANLATRCVQIHLLIWLIFSLTSMLQYNIWPSGGAVSLVSRHVAGWFGEIPDNSHAGQIATLAILGLHLAAAFLLTRPVGVGLGLVCLAALAFSIASLAGDWLYGLALLAMGAAFIPSSDPQTQRKP